MPDPLVQSDVPVTATATACATLVDSWRRAGLTTAFVAPGSRSTPLALALIAADGIALHLFHDERSASFAALGHGLATDTPAVLLCTSGTAATHFHAAVVEADASDVPMLVCTADRPPELWGVGAPQTIRQTELYGGAVRAFHEPGPPDDPDVDLATWRRLADDAWTSALGSVRTRPGPVHLNLSFRDPLVGRAGPLPPLPPDIGAADDVEPDPDPRLDEIDLADTGVIVAGRSAADPADALALGEHLGWPVLADPRSGCRRPGSAVVRFDGLLRIPEFADGRRPTTILRIGEPPASKVLSQWIARCSADGSTVVALTDRGRLIDPERVAALVTPAGSALPRLLERAASARSDASRTERAAWAAADARAEAAIESELAAHPDSEAAIARAVTAAVPTGGTLVVASSMPIRDVEWYGAARDDIRLLANRGANGIDGTIATAIAAALQGGPTVVLLGDVAFLHDSTSLIGLAHRRTPAGAPLDLTIVVVDNDGGGIFSFLPQHDILDPAAYERLFGTPHGVDLAALAGAHGLPVVPWTASLPGGTGPRIVVATTDRVANRTRHDALVAAIRSAVSDGSPAGSSDHCS